MASVLVVDDDLDSRDAVMRFLKRAGHRVRCAGNGREALRVMGQDTPDVIILDAKMPEMDGVSFLEVIRCYLRWQGLPVLFVTAYPEGLHIRRGMELGVRKTFLKSKYELSELLAHVEACAPVGLSDSEPPDDFPDAGNRLN
jgi:DNA-binding response OmpR family regulator